jgi:hypothetical protein
MVVNGQGSEGKSQSILRFWNFPNSQTYLRLGSLLGVLITENRFAWVPIRSFGMTALGAAFLIAAPVGTPAGIVAVGAAREALRAYRFSTRVGENRSLISSLTGRASAAA